MADQVILAVGIGGGLIVLGLLFGLIGWLRGVIMIRGWVSTTGVVVDRRTGRTGGAGMPDRYPTFRWHDADGQEHQRTSWVRQSLAPAAGTQVPVLYDPQTPTRAVINTFVQTGRFFLLIAALLCIAGLVTGGILLAVAL